MVTLESSKLAFDKWRASKSHGNTPIPAELWDMVEQLLQSHKKVEICRMLGISSTQIKSRLPKNPSTQTQEQQPLQSIGSFVEATPQTNVKMAELTLKGQSKTLHLYLPTTALCEVLPMLGALL